MVNYIDRRLCYKIMDFLDDIEKVLKESSSKVKNTTNEKNCDNCNSKKFVIIGGKVPLKYCDKYGCSCNQINKCNKYN